MAVFFFAMAAMFLFLLKKKLKWHIIILAGLAYVAIAGFALFSGQKNSETGGAVQEMKKSFAAGLEEAAQRGASPDYIAAAASAFDNFVIRPLAAWLIISAVFIVFLVYLVVRLYALNRYGISDGMPHFELFKPPEAVMWTFIFSMAVLAAEKFIPLKEPVEIAYNAMFVLAAVYFTAGLSVASFLFIKYKVPQPVRFFFYLCLVLWSFLGIIVMFTGMLDTWFDFRKLGRGGVAWK